MSLKIGHDRAQAGEASAGKPSTYGAWYFVLYAFMMSIVDGLGVIAEGGGFDSKCTLREGVVDEERLSGAGKALIAGLREMQARD